MLKHVIRLANYIVLFNFLLISHLIILDAHAINKKNDQSIYINSTKQTIDINKNIITFIDNVVISHGSININADKVIVTWINDQQGKEILECYGNPVVFYQLHENDNLIRGECLNIRYEIMNDTITLLGNAYLRYFNNNINGDRIIFFIKQKQMKAFSDKGKQVTTVLVPTKLQNKDIKLIK